jgi:hypothetical protein
MPKKIVTKPRPGSAAARTAAIAEKKAGFLKNYEAIGTVSGAAAQTPCDRRHVYDWLEDDPAFAEAFGHSRERAVDLAEQELRRRGVAGYDKPVFQGGKRVGTIREYSDACLIFYLKGRRRDVFGDRQELSGPKGGPIETKQQVDLSGLSGAELKQLRTILTKAKKAE